MARLIEDEAGIAALVQRMRRVAVLGIKTEAQAGQPAFLVPASLAEAGLEVIPVPVFYPDVTAILKRPVFRKVAEIGGGPVDVVDVFRRPADLELHLDDLLAARPKAVWLQLGIRHDTFARRLVEAGIDVVQDRCLLVDHQRYARRQG